VAGAKAAIRAAGLELCQSYSTDQLLALIRESPTKTRILPILDFLDDEGPKNALSDEERARLQNWVIQTLLKVQMQGGTHPSLTRRRDLALIAAMCASRTRVNLVIRVLQSQLAPARGTPRKWPQNRLKITENEVLLWDAPIQEPTLALSLRFWHAWRERLARPDQRRLYRKSLSWSHSSLLFPGPHGAPLGRAALHNALRRLSAGTELGHCSVTPERIRVAFLSPANLQPL
jgi:hypothetical protein